MLNALNELWTATFASDEGSYGFGLRILIIITNDRKRTIANVRGQRTEVAHAGSMGSLECEQGGAMNDQFEAQAVIIKNKVHDFPRRGSLLV